MSDKYLTPEDLAEIFGTTPLTILEWRRRYQWPSVRIGKTIRFTAEQVEEITSRHTVTPKKSEPSVPQGVIPGQTARSAARSR